MNKKPTRKIKILKKEKPTPKVKQSVQDLITLWNGLGLPKHKDPKSKIYIEIAKMLNKMLNGKFFDEDDEDFADYYGVKFTIDEISMSMRNFSIAATNFNFEPTGDYKTYLRKKINLKTFLYNNYSSGKEKSLFVKYFNSAPKPLHESKMLVEDLDPETTVIIKHLYEKHIIGHKPIKYDSRDENNFRKASNNLNEWFQSNKNIISNNFGLFGSDVGAKRKRADILFESIMASIGDNSKSKMTITSSWLCINRTFSERLPKYLKEMGILG